MNKSLLKKIGASAILIAINISGVLADHECTCPVCSNNKQSKQEVAISEIQNQTVEATPDVNLNNPEENEVKSDDQNVTDQTSSENPTGNSAVSLANENQNVPEKDLGSDSDENNSIENKLASEQVVAKALSDYFSSDECIQGALQSAFNGWKFVCDQFKIQKLEAIEKLAKFGFSDLNRLNNYAGNYATYVNNFFNNEHTWDEIIVDGVSIFNNDSVSKEIQHNLNLFNYSKQFEMINKSIENYKNVDWYLNDNAELLEKVIKGVKIGLDSKFDSIVDNVDSKKCVSWWIASILAYMNGAFNFYDNMMQNNIPQDQFKNILDFEFKYMDKATQSIEDLHKAVTFFYNYACEDLAYRLQKAKNEGVSTVTSEPEKKDIAVSNSTEKDTSNSKPSSQPETLGIASVESKDVNELPVVNKNFSYRVLSISLG